MDTGADGLWIARRIVNKLRIRIDASKITKAKVAGDGIITCLGKVKLKWKTVTGARMFNEVFNVFESDHTDVILGHEFLREHGVVTFNMAGLQPILAATKESKGKLTSLTTRSLVGVTDGTLDQREERKRQEKIREQGEIAHEERKIKSDKKKSASKEQRTSSKR
jgi:hypothetical protein